MFVVLSSCYGFDVSHVRSDQCSNSCLMVPVYCFVSLIILFAVSKPFIATSCQEFIGTAVQNRLA